MKGNAHGREGGGRGKGKRGGRARGEAGERGGKEKHEEAKEGSGDGGEFLLVSTHLLFPHNRNSSLIRLRETYKVSARGSARDFRRCDGFLPKLNFGLGRAILFGANSVLQMYVFSSETK